MKLKLLNRALKCLIVILLLARCEKEPYIPSHENKFAIYSILDPNLPIELIIWETTGLGHEVVESIVHSIEIYEDDNLVFSDTTSSETLSTDLYPKIGSAYQIAVKDVNEATTSFKSRLVEIYDRPVITSYYANDSVANSGINDSYYLHQFRLYIDSKVNDSPYFGYEMYVDSFPNKDESPVNITGNWTRTGGINCLEIAESPYFDRNLRIVNLTCFEDDPSLTFELNFLPPGVIDTLNFTLCNFDTHTMDFSRWLFQNFPLNSDFPIEQIFTTKDNFESDSGYDFIVNRTCKEFNIEFN